MGKDSSTDGIVMAEKDASNSSSKGGHTPVLPLDTFLERHENSIKDNGPAVNIHEIRQVFNFLDENHNGLISKDDLHHFLERLGIETTDEEVASMLNSADENGDGGVDFDEFSALYQTFSKEDGKHNDCDEELQQAFHVFDKNDDGMISPTELQEVLVNLGIEDGKSLSNCQKMIDNVDTDHDGSVDFGEFKVMMNADYGRR